MGGDICFLLFFFTSKSCTVDNDFGKKMGMNLPVSTFSRVYCTRTVICTSCLLYVNSKVGDLAVICMK